MKEVQIDNTQREYEGLQRNIKITEEKEIALQNDISNHCINEDINTYNIDRIVMLRRQLDRKRHLLRTIDTRLGVDPSEEAGEEILQTVQKHALNSVKCQKVQREILDLEMKKADLSNKDENLQRTISTMDSVGMGSRLNTMTAPEHMQQLQRKLHQKEVKLQNLISKYPADEQMLSSVGPPIIVDVEQIGQIPVREGQELQTPDFCGTGNHPVFKTKDF